MMIRIVPYIKVFFIFQVFIVCFIVSCIVIIICGIFQRCIVSIIISSDYSIISVYCRNKAYA